MPKGDRTGPPLGGGSGSGRGAGRGFGAGGRMKGNRLYAGPGGDCVCPDCGTKMPHQVGVPCYDVSCPKCGKKMTRA
jgi:hypothetical protein